jgi:RNA polymerase sigma factor (sigma-70 family)
MDIHKGTHMATGQMNSVIQHLRRTMLRVGEELTDAQLMDCFISRGDEAAIAAVVQRHAPMVWGVCRRLLRNHEDAEDAFQATFLVFVRKASSIASREIVGNWLYGVAHQTALKARATIAKRKERERQVPDMPEPAALEQNLLPDLQPLLDKELSRLSDRFRAAIILCDLEGKSRKEAARQLGLPEGTVGSRLARARVILAKRLAQRGLAMAGGSLAALLSQQSASASAPTSMVFSTIHVVTAVAAGQAVTTGLVSAKVAALTEGVMKMMFLSKLRTAAVVLFLGLVTIGTAGFSYKTLATAQTESRKETQPEQTKAPPQGAKKSIKAETPMTDTPRGGKAPAPGLDTIVWGKAADGLQAGIGFRDGETGSYRAGQSVNFIIYLRNTGDKEISVSHIETVFEEFRPSVAHAAGKTYKVLNGPINLGRVSSVKRTLEKGESIRLGTAWFVLVAPGTKGEAKAPTLVAPPGRYRVGLSGFPLRRPGNDFDEQKWATGQVEFQIEQAGPGPPGAER